MNNTLPPTGPGDNTPQPGEPNFSATWYSATQVGAIYHISRSLLKVWRNNFKLPFSKVGKKIRYNKTDIDNFLLRFRSAGETAGVTDAGGNV